MNATRCLLIAVTTPFWLAAACDRATTATGPDETAADRGSTQVEGMSSGGETGDAVAPRPHERAEMAGRVYASDFGELVLITYGPDGAAGRFAGVADDGSGAGVFTGEVRPAGDEAGGYDQVVGHWIQQAGSQRCGSARDGSHFWGRIQFNFVRNSNDLIGFYGHCDGTPLDRWNGRYLRQLLQPNQPAAVRQDPGPDTAPS